MWNSINVTLDPKMKEKVMDGSLFLWTCSKCGTTFRVPYPFLYHDMEHRFMVEFFPEKNSLVALAEFIRVKENNLDMKVINVIALKCMKERPIKGFLFERINDENQLVFTIMVEKENGGELSKETLCVPYEEYEAIHKDMEK